jgi:CO/xanthine dehydrogenase FAD-binding subunit
MDTIFLISGVPQVKAHPFEYHRPSSVDEAIAMRLDAGETSMFLAGGQSLVPLMAMRRSRPSALIDLNTVHDLFGVTEQERTVSIGAMTRQQDLCDAASLLEQVPVLESVVHNIGHPGTRSRGTIGGSVCHADPAAELPALLIALDAQVVLTGADGRRRTLPVDAFVDGAYRTTIGETELLTSVEIPKVAQRRMGFSEIEPRSRDFALAGAVAAGRVDPTGEIEELRIVLFAVGQRPLRLPTVEAAAQAAGHGSPGFAAASGLVRELVTPRERPGLAPDYLRHLAVVAVRRALEGLAEQAA